MSTQLAIFNEACRILAQPSISSPSDQNERARTLLDAWTPAVLTAMEQGAWQWGITRAGPLAQLATPPVWGRLYAYQLPGDCVRVVFVSPSGIEWDDAIDEDIENGMIASDEPIIFVKYVSNTSINTPGKWGQGFADWISAEMAFRSAPKIAPAREEAAGKILITRRKIALSSDAVNQPPQIRKEGNWARAHRNRFIFGGQSSGRSGGQ